MSLDKAIIHGKEHRKKYRGAKAVDKTCRNHGGCPYCEAGRLHKYLRQMPAQDKDAVKSLYRFKRRYKNEHNAKLEAEQANDGD
jgi:hypothetical protein